jgi:xanthine dehydrogenase accessory factor
MNVVKSNLCILVRGANDVASAAAHRLFTAGYSVVIHETPQPTTARRKMSFTDSVFDGRAALEGLEARLLKRLYLLRGALAAHQVIPVVVKDFHELLRTLHPQILVDARMRKHLQPEPQRGLAEFTIGLGPNFTAGDSVDVAIETSWGNSLGQIIGHGATNSLQGEPREIDGHARDRYVYAPVAGTFHTTFQIGEPVSQGQEIARINATPLHAPITGVLRGLTRDGVPVTPRTKVIEVDPRAQGAQVSGIGERPARIAEGVLTAIQNWESAHIS